MNNINGEWFIYRKAHDGIIVWLGIYNNEPYWTIDGGKAHVFTDHKEIAQRLQHQVRTYGFECRLIAKKFLGL